MKFQESKRAYVGPERSLVYVGDEVYCQPNGRGRVVARVVDIKKVRGRKVFLLQVRNDMGGFDEGCLEIPAADCSV